MIVRKKAFIFDLDGVIVDTAKYHYLAWKKLVAGMGISFSEEQNEQLKGVSRVKSLEKILAWGNLSVSEDRFMELMARKNDDYLQYISNMTEEEILPGVVPILEFLKKEGQFIGLGSASKNARPILKKVGLSSYFDCIVDGTDITKAKPDPQVFLKGAENMGVPATDCIVFEDSQSGIQAANTAGMISIGIGSKDILNQADHVFSGFDEVSIDFIKQLIEK